MTDTPLLNLDGRVLAAVDASAHADSVADHAGWAAARLRAPLELLHTLERPGSAPTSDLSGSIALGSQEALLEELADIDARRARLAQERGRTLLDGLRARIAERYGVEADVRQRHGSVADTLLELEPQMRLVVIGRRGEHAARAQGHLGSNLERVIRSVHRPVLVAPQAFRPVTRFLVAFDGSVTTRRCVDMVAASPLLQGAECHVLSVGERTPGLDTQLDWAASRLRAAGFEPQVHVEPGTPEAVIAGHVGRIGIDLLVMGAYGHSRIRSMIVGSTTTQLLRQCDVPVLLLR